MTLTAAADGSALGNPGPAGWAWYVDDACWGAGGWAHATNNQGELKAVLELFRATAHLDEDLLVLCDSQYVINSVTKWMRGWKAKGWRKGDGKPVMNLELLKELDEALAGRKYRFEWVKGHDNHPLNEAADVRARAVAEAFQRRSPIPEGPGCSRWGADSAAPAVTSTSTTAAEPPEPVDAASVPGPPVAAASVPAAPVAAEPMAAASAPVSAAAPGAPTQPGLFDLDADDEPVDEPHTVVLDLSDDDYARLVERAELRGLSIEDLLRSLI